MRPASIGFLRILSIAIAGLVSSESVPGVSDWRDQGSSPDGTKSWRQKSV